jgi:hypothetical protein
VNEEDSFAFALVGKNRRTSRVPELHRADQCKCAASGVFLAGAALVAAILALVAAAFSTWKAPPPGSVTGLFSRG